MNLTTPYPLEWQLGTSFERLVVQYWPAAIWWVFLAYPVAPAETMEARRSGRAVAAIGCGGTALVGRWPRP